MRKKKIKYPFSLFMLFSVILFWGAVSVSGYQLKLDGTLVKVETAPEEASQEPDRSESEAAETGDAETGNAETGDAENGSAEPEYTEPEYAESEAPEVIQEERAFVQVGADYLDGALFIGDSRVATLYEYAGWEKTHFFVEYGLSVWDVMDKKLGVDKETGGKITVREALGRETYEKIYIQLGINELGRGTADSFYMQYKAVVDEIRTLQPDAVIFVQSIMHVTDKKDRQGTYINNAEIDARNAKLKTLADNRYVFWLDENEVFDLEGTGKLNPDYSSDGVHLKAKYIDIWTEFLLAHGIETGGAAEG
ncbi:MAG: hypothetical protein KH452_04725 [Clostridiales bacterium]|nr:hypothetical protein [Clostridiales bacterium]